MASIESEFHWQDQVDQQSSSVVKLGTGLFIVTILACTLLASYMPLSKGVVVSAKFQMPTMGAIEPTHSSALISNQLRSDEKGTLRRGLNKPEYFNSVFQHSEISTAQLDRRATGGISIHSNLNHNNQPHGLRGTENWSGQSDPFDPSIANQDLIAELQSELKSNLHRQETLSAAVKAKKGRLEKLQLRFQKLEGLAKNGYIARNRIKEHRWVLLETQRTVSALEGDLQLLSEETDRVRTLIAKIKTQTAVADSPPFQFELKILPEQSDNTFPTETSVRDPFPTGSVPVQPQLPIRVKRQKTDFSENLPISESVIVHARVATTDLKFIQRDKIAKVDFQSDGGNGVDSYLGQVISNPNGSDAGAAGLALVRVRIVDSGPDQNEDMPVPLSQRLAGKTGTIRFQANNETFLTRLINPFTKYLKREKWTL